MTYYDQFKRTSIESSFDANEFENKINEVNYSIDEINQQITDELIAQQKNTGYIYVGDSRFVGMNNCLNIENEQRFVIAEVAMGYDWLVNTAYPKIVNIKSNNSKFINWKIIINLGVNDIGNINKYIEFYSNNFKSDELEIIAVNPIEYNDYISNSDIESFNLSMKSFAEQNNIKYIDTYNMLKNSGFSTTDGVHFDNDTYSKIFLYIEDNK
jgi:hypothetical protein